MAVTNLPTKELKRHVGHRHKVVGVGDTRGEALRWVAWVRVSSWVRVPGCRRAVSDEIFDSEAPFL